MYIPHLPTFTHKVIDIKMLFVFLCEHFVRVFDYFRSTLHKIDGNSGMILSGTHLRKKQ